MCLKVVGENNYFFVSFTSEKWLILSRILAIFLHFCEILNIRDKNETYCFLTYVQTTLKNIFKNVHKITWVRGM